MTWEAVYGTLEKPVNQQPLAVVGQCEIYSCDFRPLPRYVSSFAECLAACSGELYQYLMDVGLNITVTMVLIVGACMAHKRPAQTP